MKYFIVTIDAEGDNLWGYEKGGVVRTENSLYVPQFQELCEKYKFIPVWLTSYEMACDSRYVNYIKPKMDAGLCEVGIHIHAWNNPPYYDLNGEYSGAPYLIEYPPEIMRSKFKLTYDLITNKFGVPPISHRAGRWAMNDEYFCILKENGVLIDCSFTPFISWTNAFGETLASGMDYSRTSISPSFIGDVLEIPMTIRPTHFSLRKSIRHKLRTFLKGDMVWLRPAMSSREEMISLINKVSKEPHTNYLEFMIHSSELMPGGSPYFKTSESIDTLLYDMDFVFAYAKRSGYSGISLKDYYSIVK